MRIGIDARFYGSLGKGLGRYTQKLIENLEKVSSEDKFFIFLRKENWDEYQPANKNFSKVLANIPWYGVREQVFFPRILKKYNLDLVHFPHFNVPVFWKGKFVVTIHDLILFHFPTQRATTLSPFYYFLKKIAHRIVIRNAVKKSEKIIAVSRFTKKDILKHFRVSSRKIAVTLEAVDRTLEPLRASPQQIHKKYGIIKPYILYVGNAYPHKNLERLVLVFREFVRKHPHLHLVLVGKEDYFYRRLKKFVKDNRIRQVIFTDFVPDGELGTLYKEALLYIFPSLYEGFGLPPLEAMSWNLPVASSNASCLPEILGDAACYFDPQALTEMAETIEKVATNGEVRQKLISGGHKQVKKYSWEKMARETLDIYKNCA